MADVHLSPLSDIAPEDASRATAEVGVSTLAARADHKHDVATAAPGTIQPDDAASEGAAVSLARSDHRHAIASATAVEITDATNDEGGSTSFARADHQHAHGIRGGGTLHAQATSGTDGFMSASDKDALDGTPLYIQSRSAGLITNGTALQGTNYNFSTLDFDGANAPGLPGSFKFTGYFSFTFAIETDEFIPIDPNAMYEVTGYVMQSGEPGDYSAYAYGNRHLFYAGIKYYDADKLLISPWHHVTEPGSAHTTLAADLNPGDTVIYLVDATGWNNTDATKRKCSIRFMNYSNSFGHVYEYYSRNFMGYKWSPGAVNYTLNTITLDAPWSGASYTAGTIVHNGWGSGSYKYSLAFAQVIPAVDKWCFMQGFFGGIDRSGTGKQWNCDPGTAYAKLFFFPVYSNRAGGWTTYPDTGPAQREWFAGLSLTRRADGLLVAQTDGSWEPYIPVPSAAVGASTGTITLTRRLGAQPTVLL